MRPVFQIVGILDMHRGFCGMDHEKQPDKEVAWRSFKRICGYLHDERRTIFFGSL